MLLPQTRSPEVDYSFFIMETVEMVLEKKETTPAGLRRSFPPPICCLLASVSGFSRVRRLPPKNVGGPLYKGFLGQDGVVEKKIDGSGAPRPNLVGPTRPGTGAAWAHLFAASGLRLLASFAPKSSSFQKNDSRNFSAHYDVIKAPEIRKEKYGVI